MSNIDPDLLFDPEIHRELGAAVIVDSNVKGALAEARANLEFNLAHTVVGLGEGRWVAGPTFAVIPADGGKVESHWYGIWEKAHDDAS